MTDRVLTEAQERGRHLAVIVADETGVIQSWSDGAAALFGYPASEAIGHSMGELIVPPTFLAQHEEGLRRFAARHDSGRLGGSFTMLARDASGSHFPIDLSVFALELPGTRWMLGVARPLSEASPAAMLSDDIIATVFERAPEAITLLDPLGRQISVNAVGAAMVGFGDEGRYPGDGRGFIHQDDRDRTARHFADVLSGRFHRTHRAATESSPATAAGSGWRRFWQTSWTCRRSGASSGSPATSLPTRNDGSNWTPPTSPHRRPATNSGGSLTRDSHSLPARRTNSGHHSVRSRVRSRHCCPSRRAPSRPSTAPTST
jgi:PAS domain S-box-containing protein